MVSHKKTMPFTRNGPKGSFWYYWGLRSMFFTRHGKPSSNDIIACSLIDSFLLFLRRNNNFSSLKLTATCGSNFDKCTVAMQGGPCSQHITGNTWLNQLMQLHYRCTHTRSTYTGYMKIFPVCFKSSWKFVILFSFIFLGLINNESTLVLAIRAYQIRLLEMQAYCEIVYKYNKY